MAREEKMSKIIFEIIGIPVAKGRPRFARAGRFVRTYTPDKTRAYESNVLAQALQHRPPTPIDTAISVDLTFYLPIPASMPKKYQAIAESETIGVIKKPDLDNLIKAAIDPLNGVFWTDDSRITHNNTRKLYSRNPRTRYIITYEGGIRNGRQSAV